MTFVTRTAEQYLRVTQQEEFNDVQRGIFELLMQSYTANFGHGVGSPFIVAECKVTDQAYAAGESSPSGLLVVGFAISYETRFGYDIEAYPLQLQAYVNGNLEKVTDDMKQRFLPVEEAQRVIVYKPNPLPPGPSSRPSSSTSSRPSPRPSSWPSPKPSIQPSPRPSSELSLEPSNHPSTEAPAMQTDTATVTAASGPPASPGSAVSSGGENSAAASNSTVAVSPVDLGVTSTLTTTPAGSASTTQPAEVTDSTSPTEPITSLAGAKNELMYTIWLACFSALVFMWS